MRRCILITVQVTGSNVSSVAEDEVMRMLILIRNFVPGYLQASLCSRPALITAEAAHCIVWVEVEVEGSSHCTSKLFHMGHLVLLILSMSSVVRC